MENVNAIPKGYDRIIPHIFVNDSAAAIEFYEYLVQLKSIVTRFLEERRLKEIRKKSSMQ